MSKRKHPPIKSSIASEPYRFICEYCGSCAIVMSGIDTSPLDNKKDHFYCESCYKSSKYVYDKKNGVEIHIDELGN